MALLVSLFQEEAATLHDKMNEIKRLLASLEKVIGHDSVAPLQWHVENERFQCKILLPIPPPQSVTGEYVFGQLFSNQHTGTSFGLREEELPQHISIFGRTGSGKTNCAYIYLNQLQKKKKPFLVFDWKQSYRNFSHHESVDLLTPGNPTAPFHFNPLSLQHITTYSKEGYIRHLLSVIINIYFHNLQLLSVEGTEYLLLRGLSFFLHQGEPFTFRDLYHWALAYKATSRERDWKSSLLNVLYKLSTGPIGEVLNNPEPVDIRQLTHRSCIIELQWLGSPKDKSFLIQSILLQLYYHFSQCPPTNSLRLAVLIEEAHNILLRHQGEFETVIEMALRQIREYGVSLCLLDQHPSLMSLPALGTYCSIAFSLRAQADIDQMGAMLALEGEDKTYLQRLSTGQAIIKLQGRYLKPFAVRFPKAVSPISLPLTYQDFLEIYRPNPSTRTDLPRSDRIYPEITVSAQTHAAIPQNAVSDLPRRDRIYQEISGSRSNSKRAKLMVNQKDKLLFDIFSHPLSPTTKRYHRLQLNPKTGNQLQQELVDGEFIDPVTIPLARHRIKLFKLTPMGEQYLRDRGINPKCPGRRGSLLHQYWIANIMGKYKAEGYRVTEEFLVGQGKAIDVVVEKDDQRIAIEVETGLSNIIANVEKCAQAGYKEMIIFAVNKQAKNKIKQLLRNRKLTIKINIFSPSDSFITA